VYDLLLVLPPVYRLSLISLGSYRAFESKWLAAPEDTLRVLYDWQADSCGNEQFVSKHTVGSTTDILILRSSLRML
jgi:hypothetical protein